MANISGFGGGCTVDGIPAFTDSMAVNEWSLSFTLDEGTVSPAFGAGMETHFCGAGAVSGSFSCSVDDGSIEDGGDPFDITTTSVPWDKLTGSLVLTADTGNTFTLSVIITSASFRRPHLGVMEGTFTFLNSSTDFAEVWS